DIPESLNLFSYNLASTVDDKIFLNCSLTNTYSTNFEDAKWIARKMASLTEGDWYDIAMRAQMPSCPTQLLFEILKNRRNSMVQIFSLKNDARYFPVNVKLNCGEKEVVDGIQVKKSYPGDPYLYAHDRFE